MFERSFFVAGCRVQIVSRGEDLATVVDAFFGGLGDAQSAHPQIRVSIDRCAEPPVPPTSPPRFQFPPLSAFLQGDGWLLVDDVGWLSVDSAAGTIQGAVHAQAGMSCLFDFVALALWLAIAECLRARGRYLLHAAALIAPWGETVLLAGSRKTGKSTLTLALLQCGYTALSDDTVFVVRTEGDGVALLAHPRRFQVRPDLIVHRKELATLTREPSAFEPQDKRWLVQNECFPGRLALRANAPARIFFPRITGEATSRLVPRRARQTLLALLEHSCFVFVEPQLAPRHLDALRALAFGKDAAELHCGLDLLRNPARVADLISEDSALWAAHSLASN